MGDVFVRLLGPIEVIGPLGVADLAPGRQRALVGLLALEAGKMVSQHRLVDALWGEEPPRTAVRSLQSYVARARGALKASGLPDVLRTHDPGYVLGLGAHCVDVAVFDGAQDEARGLVEQGRLREAATALRSGLELWRGEPLADGPVFGWGEAATIRLTEARLVASEELWDIELRLGAHARALPELEQLATLHPSRERLVAALMLALHRSGRSGEALEAYRRLRALMIEELGVEPGSQVQRLHTAILQHDPALDLDARPAPEPVAMARGPAQLPPTVGYFVGREDQLALLDQVIADPADADDAAPVVVICGAAGVGKTSLVIQWARRRRDRFPDGQIFVDLRGHDPGATMSVDEAMATALRALGLPAQAVPADPAEQSALLRSLIHDRRLLIVLDNAATTDQVLPMVPATNSSLLMVTSRNQLAGVAAHHRVLPIRLDLLQPNDSLKLLSKVLGSERSGDEPQATAELAELCGHLPLALRIAAAKLVALGGQRIADFVAELGGHDRLDALAVEGDSRSVTAVFATAYRALTPQPALVFRTLGLHPGTTFGPHAAAALAHIGVRQAQATLDTLSTAHLVDQVGPGRYRFHDLVRLYAVERARAEMPAGDRASAIDRLLDWYLAVGDAANRLIDPGRDRVTLGWEVKPELPPFPDIDSVLSFLDLEYPNLVPLTAHAARNGAEQAAWQLAYLMVGYLDSRGHAREREQMWRWGLAAAKKLDDPTVKGLAHSGLGLAHIRMRRFAEGLRQLETALDLMRATGDKRGEGHALSNMALVYTKQRRYQDAADFFYRSLEIHEAGDHPLGVALAINNLGYVLALTGQTSLALSYLERGLHVARELGSGRVQAAILRTMGNVHHRGGDYPAAVSYLHEALELKRMVHDDSYQVEALNDLATFHAAAGDWDAALGSATQALSLATTLGDQHLQAAAGLRLARALIGCGELVSAGERLRHAMELRQQTPDEFEEAMLHEQLARLAALSGGHDESNALRDRAISLYENANATPEAQALRVWRG